MGPMNGENAINKYRSCTKCVLSRVSTSVNSFGRRQLAMVVRNVGPTFELWGIFHVIAPSALNGPIF